CNFDNVRIALAHPEQGTAARREAAGLHRAYGVHPVAVPVGGADVAVERLAGVQVVVVGEDAGLFQPLGLRRTQESQARAELGVRERLSHAADSVRDLADITVARAASG